MKKAIPLLFLTILLLIFCGCSSKGLLDDVDNGEASVQSQEEYLPSESKTDQPVESVEYDALPLDDEDVYKVPADGEGSPDPTYNQVNELVKIEPHEKSASGFSILNGSYIISHDDVNGMQLRKNSSAEPLALDYVGAILDALEEGFTDTPSMAPGGIVLQGNDYFYQTEQFVYFILACPDHQGNSSIALLRLNLADAMFDGCIAYYHCALICISVDGESIQVIGKKDAYMGGMTDGFQVTVDMASMEVIDYVEIIDFYEVLVDSDGKPYPIYNQLYETVNIKPYDPVMSKFAILNGDYIVINDDSRGGMILLSPHNDEEITLDYVRAVHDSIDIDFTEMPSIAPSRIILEGDDYFYQTDQYLYFILACPDHHRLPSIVVLKINLYEGVIDGCVAYHFGVLFDLLIDGREIVVVGADAPLTGGNGGFRATIDMGSMEVKGYEEIEHELFYDLYSW